ncbi:MAG: hypothetical protein CMI58_01495 [Parcubacteria group bacterium]|jgi:xylulokinase|nr:hypothetical protein [Parcubacteria group bacterium]|tara:strand:+ start:8208 stop:9719 length:1512 start_codon:yes stop_codon:yes gene_type:complete
MNKKIILTVDSSTSSSTTMVWDVKGNLVFKTSKKIKLYTPKTGYYEQNAKEWIQSLIDNLKKISLKFLSYKILSICITNQRETFVPVDQKGKPLRPAITWLDERCKKEVDSFPKTIGLKKIHQITGKNIDIIPSIYKIVWIKNNEKKIFYKTYKFLDVQSYLVWFLTNKFKTSWASSDSSGLFDVKKKRWSKVILKKLGLDENNFPESHKPGSIVGHLTLKASKITGLKKDIPVMVGGGDGQSAFMGTVCNFDNSAFLNLGTSVNSGIFSQKYFFDKSCKTSLSLDNKGYILENPIKAGTFSIDWYLNNILKLKKIKNYKKFEKKIKNSSIRKTGLFFTPYLLGAMGPYWDSNARGILIGISGNTSQLDIYRSIMESIVLEQIFTLNIVLKKINKRIKKIIAVGGGAKSNLWCQMFANISGLNIERPRNSEGTSLGIAILSLTNLGYYNSYKTAANLILKKQKKTIFVPDKKEIIFSRKLLNLYSKIYLQNKSILNEIKEIRD